MKRVFLIIALATISSFSLASEQSSKKVNNHKFSLDTSKVDKEQYCVWNSKLFSKGSVKDMDGALQICVDPTGGKSSDHDLVWVKNK